MPRVACPHCKTIVSATEEQRGSVLACSGCQRSIRIPRSTAVQAPAQSSRPAAAPATEEAQEKIKAGRPSKGPSGNGPPPPRPELDEDDVEEVTKKRRPAEEDDEPEEDIDRPARKAKKKKKKSKAATGAFSGAGGLVFLIILILILSGRGFDTIKNALQGLLEALGIHPMVALGVTVVILIVPLGILWAVLMKSTVVGSLPDDVECRPARRRDFPDMDDDPLDDYTEAFEALGFRKLTDYTVETDPDNGNQAFARLFYHDGEHCFAEINQVITAAGQAVPMRCNIMSLLEDGWTVSNGNRQPTRELYLLRRPRAVWRSFPDAKPKKLLKEHLALRGEMVEALEIDVRADADAEAYFAQQKAAAHEWKQRISARWAVGVALELWLFPMFPKTEWLGNYAKKAK